MHISFCGPDLDRKKELLAFARSLLKDFSPLCWYGDDESILLRSHKIPKDDDHREVTILSTAVTRYLELYRREAWNLISAECAIDSLVELYAEALRKKQQVSEGLVIADNSTYLSPQEVEAYKAKTIAQTVAFLAEHEVVDHWDYLYLVTGGQADDSLISMYKHILGEMPVAQGKVFMLDTLDNVGEVTLREHRENVWPDKLEFRHR